MLITMGVSLFTSRIILNTLGIVDFGINNVVGGVVGMFAFINASMANATSRFLTFEIGKKNKEKLIKVFKQGATIHVFLAILIIILAETFGLWFVVNKLVIPEDRLNAVFWIYQITIITCALNIINIPYISVIIAHERMNVYAYIALFDAFAKLVVVYLLTVIPFDKLILCSLLFLVITVIDWAIYHFYSKNSFKEARFRLFWDRQLFKEMSSFAGWNLFTQMAILSFSQGVSIILNIFFGPVLNAARGITDQVQNAVSSFYTNFQTALNPQIIKSYAESDKDYLKRLVMASSKYTFMLLWIFILPIVLQTPYILELWLGKIPDYTVVFIRIMLISRMVQAVGNPLSQVVYATGNIAKYQIVTNILYILVCPISYVVLKFTSSEPLIVYVILLLIEISVFVARLYITLPILKITFVEYLNMVFKRTFYICVLSLLVSGVFNYYFASSELAKFICVLIISEFSIFITFLLVGIDSDEKQFIRDRITVLRKRFLN